MYSSVAIFLRFPRQFTKIHQALAFCATGTFRLQRNTRAGHPRQNTAARRRWRRSLGLLERRLCFGGTGKVFYERDSWDKVQIFFVVRTEKTDILFSLKIVYKSSSLAELGERMLSQQSNIGSSADTNKTHKLCSRDYRSRGCYETIRSLKNFIPDKLPRFK